MRHAIRRAAPFILALAVPAAAYAAPEGLAVSAGAQFEAAAFGVQASRFRPTLPAGAPLPLNPGAYLDEQMRAGTTVPPVDGRRAFAGGPAAEFELASLLNAHLKTALRFTLSGRSVWFSGAFDQKQTAYVSVTVDGAGTRYFDIRALLNHEQKVAVGGATYTLSLSPNIFHKSHSTLHLRNDADDREAANFQIQQMLDAVAAVGGNASVAGQAYKIYYTDGPTNGGSDARARLFAFIYGPTDNFHVYLVPESLVPTDKIAVFQMFNGQRVGLARPGGRLQVFANP